MMDGSAYLITPPTDPVVTLAEVKTMLGITGSGSDNQLTAEIAAVSESLDAATGGWLARALRPQTWELRLSAFPCEPIRLPYPPVTAVSSVKYDDANGDEQTLVEGTSYRVFGLNDMWATKVAAPYGSNWPAARCDTQSVRIRYVAGYPLTPADLMPAAVKAAIALGVRALQSTSSRDPSLTAQEIPGVQTLRWGALSEASQQAVERSIRSLLDRLVVYYA